jgi:hypothetical protein
LFPGICAKAGPAIKAVATRAAANFLNMIVFSFLPARRRLFASRRFQTPV